jgi:hypothetical protein
MHADKGVIKYLRWENAQCANCGEERCLKTGTVYEGKATNACAADPEKCTDDPFSYAAVPLSLMKRDCAIASSCRFLQMSLSLWPAMPDFLWCLHLSAFHVYWFMWVYNKKWA